MNLHLELRRHEAVVELLGVPLPDDEAIRINDEEVGNIVIREQIRLQHDHANLKIWQDYRDKILFITDLTDPHGVDCRVDHLVGGDGDGKELVGEVQTGLIVEDGRPTVPGGSSKGS